MGCRPGAEPIGHSPRRILDLARVPTAKSLFPFPMRGANTRVEALMDKDEKQKSDLGNAKNLKNAEGNNVTGVRTSELRRVDDEPATPDPRALDPKNQDPRSQDRGLKIP
jgi:hypothetical protein